MRTAGEVDVDVDIDVRAHSLRAREAPRQSYGCLPHVFPPFPRAQPRMSGTPTLLDWMSVSLQPVVAQTMDARHIHDAFHTSLSLVAGLAIIAAPRSDDWLSVSPDVYHGDGWVARCGTMLGDGTHAHPESEGGLTPLSLPPLLDLRTQSSRAGAPVSGDARARMRLSNSVLIIFTNVTTCAARICMITLALGTLGYKYVHIYEDPAFFIYTSVEVLTPASSPRSCTIQWLRAAVACIVGGVAPLQRRLHRRPRRSPWRCSSPSSAALAGVQRGGDSIIDIYSMGLSIIVINVSLAKVPRLISAIAIVNTAILLHPYRHRGRQLVLEDLMNERPLDWLPIHVVVVLSSTSSSARATLHATRRRRRNRQDRTPVGIAVLIAFFFGAVGTRMGVAQVSYIGKIGVLFRAFSSSYPFYLSPDAIHLRRAGALPRAQVHR
ncbi:hypothetical protein B0H16DRAFT_1741635 [Mycena metata]|uniref:Uncharacterized protein n=1 Tax=Mycena metata TaxID=1033252 RepID=A0AAD7MGI2_9AGAR|nr:hypothetical protein B0H16DRAFT_1741635 [Mycena metata]